MSGSPKPSLALPALVVLGLLAPAHAQIATDGTVGPRVELGGPEFAIGAELGRQAGRNLFHSFERFSLSAGERATFSGPAQIENVISRVTGGARSDIDGTIRSTIPGADFYLINPAGILFGPHASLDLSGSFHVSTADEVRFRDDATFSANLDPAASSFTVAAPEAFGFLASAPAPILVDQSVLEVPVGEALSIVGGDIDITGGPRGLIRAEAGQITLAAVGGPGEARLGSAAIDADRQADISLTDQALVTTSGDGGGTIHVRASSFAVADQSLVFADNNGAADAIGGIDVEADRMRVSGGSALTTDVLGAGRGGNLLVNATALRLTDESVIGAAALDRGDAGAVRIVAGELEILAGSEIRSSTFSGGDGGTVVVEADRLLIRGADSDSFTGITSSAEPGSAGDAGAVRVAAGRLEIGEGGEVRSSTLSEGAAGTVRIVAGELEILAGGVVASSTSAAGNAGSVIVQADRLLIQRGDSAFFTGVTSGTGPGSSGEAGTVRVMAGELGISAGGTITTSTNSAADAGEVTVEADRLLIRGGALELFTGISSNANPGSAGDAGSVQVATGDLEILNGGAISSSTFSQGDGGRVTVQADRLLIRGGASERFTGIATGAERRSSGAAGTVQLVAGVLELSAGGQVRSVTFADGDAGIVQVEADRVLIRGGASGIFSSAATSVTGEVGQGDAGIVRIQAETVEISGGGGVGSSADGPGTAGDVILRAADRLILDAASITTATVAAGGGEIQLLVGDLIDLRDSVVNTSVAGGADPTAGNILIDPKVLVIEGSRIQANAPIGFGGTVTIVADNILVPGGDFAALLAQGDISATGGDPTRAGTIVVDAPETDLAGDLVILQPPLLNAAALLREPCGARREVSASSFTGVGRGGLPASPDAPLRSAYRGAPSDARADASEGSATSFAGSQGVMSHVAGCASAP